VTPSPILALDLLTAGIFGLLAVTGIRNRDHPGALVASGLWLVLAVVAAGLAAGRLDLVTEESAISVGFLGWVLAVSLWAGFVFSYTHRGPTPTRRGTVAGACYVAVVAVTTLYGTVIGGPASGGLRLVMAVVQTLHLGVGLFSVFLVVRSGRIDTGVSGWQAIFLSFGGLSVSLFLFTISTLDANDPGNLPAVMSGVLTIGAVAFAVSTFAVGLFEAAPAAGPLARQSLLERMREAVVVVDREQRLVDANAAAERTFEISLEDDAGRPATSVVGVDLESIEGEPVTIHTAQGSRAFRVSSSALTSHRGETVGRSYLFRDVTDRQTRRQRLAVLDRVLRHNLRNDLDAIRGFAEGLSDDVADDHATVADRIDSLASELVEIGETVERTEQITARETLAPEPVDLVVLARDVVTDVGQGVEFESGVSTGGESVRLRTDPDVLRAALREVVENAVEHTDRPVPTVRIEVSGTGDTGKIAVRDDGPGIPERERRVLLEGVEDPLRHGSGVGLWFVSWAVTRLGGELALDTPDGGGSEVLLTIPDYRANDPTAAGRR
jgi:signal transduction histidine kinase